MDTETNTIQPTIGNAYSAQDKAMAMFIKNRCHFLPDNEEGGRFLLKTYSTVARLVARAIQYDTFTRGLAKWSKQPDLKSKDYSKLLEEYPLASVGTCKAENKEEICSGCQALTALEASFKSFNGSIEELKKAKKKLTEARKAHTVAEKKLTEANEAQTAAERSTQVAAAEERVVSAAALSDLAAALAASAQDRVADNAALFASAAALVASAEDHVPDKAALVASAQDHVAKDADSVADKAALVAEKAKSVANAHRTVKCLLGALRTAGNDSLLSMASGSENQIPERSNTTGRSRIAALPIDDEFDELCAPSVISLDDFRFLLPLSRTLERKIGKLYERLKLFLGKPTPLIRKRKNDTKYNTKIEKTVKGILALDVSKPPKAPAETIFTPGFESQETEGVQPILFAIMVKIALVLKSENRITREQGLLKVGNRPSRFIDFAVVPVEEYLMAILPAMMGVPIEVKPIARKNTKFEQLLLEAQNQLVGHLAKRVDFFFNVGGIGENCEAFGLELTMGSVALIVIRLAGMGTSAVKVTSHRSERFPLFDKETRVKMFGEKANKDVEASLAVDVDAKPNSTPLGFLLLVRMLNSIKHGTGSSPIRHWSFVSLQSANVEFPIQVGQYLGSGAFAHVSQLKIADGEEVTDVFIKMPKSLHLSKSLDKEAAVLKALMGNSQIPQPYDFEDPIKNLRLKIRCETSNLPCLPLRGIIGKPTSERRDWNLKQLNEICMQTYAALEYAHKKQWAHLDVRPSNIIFRAASRGASRVASRGASRGASRDCLEVMLIDWGCAHRTGKSVKGFVGCPPYALDELFGLSRTWKPRRDHDLASLAYTMVCISKSVIPWSGFPNHHAVAEDIKKTRQELASTHLKKLFRNMKLDPVVANELLAAIGDKTRKRKRK